VRAIIWKEWRENFKWAVLGALAIGLAMVLSRSMGEWVVFGQGDASICSASFLMVTVIGSAAVGAVLGFLQVVLELHRDQWGFLLHRPITRTSIFLGKVVGGLVPKQASLEDGFEIEDLWSDFGPRDHSPSRLLL
jgi:ABC-type transport system involved in multi-copper enzyme maturation permease subunit